MSLWVGPLWSWTRRAGVWPQRAVPAPWITTIYGAELWAVLMVRRHAMPGAAAIFADCQAVQKDSDRGHKWATAPCRTLAGVWAGVNMTRGACGPRAIWMPSHTAAHEVGVRRKSDGTLLTAADRRANDLADTLAKAAAEGQRMRQRRRTGH